MYKKFVLFLFACTIVTSVSSQFQNPDEKMNYVARQLQKFRWDMNIGTSYTYFSGYGGGMNYFASPGFSYPINNRFSFHGGITTGVFTQSGIPGQEIDSQGISSGYTSVYGSVSYQVNPNVIIYGTGVKNLSSYGSINPFYTSGYDEISFGSTIQLGNNVSVGAAVSFRNYGSSNKDFYSPFFQQKPW